METGSPSTSTLVLASRPRLLLRLVSIFVLSGCSSSPYCLACCRSCVSIVVICGNVDATSITSSAKRKLVSVVVEVWPSCTP